MRKRLNKLMDKVQFEQECNASLKEENIMFYKENEKMKLILESEMIEERYRELLTKLAEIEKQFEQHKRRITRVALAKELKTNDIKNKMGIEREINEIIKRVNASDFLDLEMAVFPTPEEKSKMYHSISAQTEPSVESVGVNTYMNVYKRAVTTQVNFTKHRKLDSGRQIEITIEPESAYIIESFNRNYKKTGK